MAQLDAPTQLRHSNMDDTLSMFPAKKVGNEGWYMHQTLKNGVQVTCIVEVLEAWWNSVGLRPCRGDGAHI